MHFEEKKSKWNFTNVILGLLKQTEVAESWSRLMSQRHGEGQICPRFTWESKKCNRLRYKLETKWDTRVFDVDKVVQETYDLAEIEPADMVEPKSETTPEVQEIPEPTESATETISCKLEMDFGTDQRLHSSHGLPSDGMMDLDPVDTPHAMHHDMPTWPVSTDMTPTTMAADPVMGAFGGFNPNMAHMSADFSQPVNQGFQPTWANAGFVSTPDLVSFQPQNSYLDYSPQKEVVQVPTSQYANFGHYPRQSVPPNFMHHPSTPSTPTSSRRFVPKLINIASSTQRPPTSHMSDHPPPPPPKDEHTNRFSRMIMRRRPSNISQHTVVSQREIGWQDELNWG